MQVKHKPFFNLLTQQLHSLCLLVSSADNLCKQFGSRSGPTECPSDLDADCLSLMLLLKEFFEKVDFENNLQTTNNPEKLPRMQRGKITNDSSKGSVFLYIVTKPLHTGYFSGFCCRLLTIFKSNLFKKIFQEHYQSVKQLGSRSGPTFCRSWSGS